MEMNAFQGRSLRHSDRIHKYYLWTKTKKAQLQDIFHWSSDSTQSVLRPSLQESGTDPSFPTNYLVQFSLLIQSAALFKKKKKSKKQCPF